MWTLEVDIVKYGEWKTDTCTEGSNYALLSFARKVGQGSTGDRGLVVTPVSFAGVRSRRWGR
jgi:Na+/melibiose symporter-like transporter